MRRGNEGAGEAVQAFVTLGTMLAGEHYHAEASLASVSIGAT